VPGTENAPLFAIRGNEASFFAFYGDTGVIGDFLSGAGQALKRAVLPQLGLPTSAIRGVAFGSVAMHEYHVSFI
jgi:hypothetical protein